MKKKILIVTNIDGNGGSEQFIRVIARYLSEKGLYVALYTLKRTKEIDIFADAHISNLNKGWGFFASLFKLKSVMASYKPDIVFSFLNKSAHVTRLMNVLFDFQHVLFFNSIRITLLDTFFYNYLLSISQKTICIADSNITRYCITKKLDTNIDLIIPPFFLPDNLCNRSIPYFMNPEKKVLTFGIISRLSKEKGLSSLLETVKILHEDKNMPAFQVKIAGDGSEYKKYVDYIYTHELPVEIVGHIRDIYSFLESIDVYIQPSHYEGFCLSIHEALSVGLFIIASDKAGEVTYDKFLRQHNLFFRTGSAHSMSRTIKQFLALPRKKVHDNQKANKDYMLEHYPRSRFDHTVNQLLQLLDASH